MFDTIGGLPLHPLVVHATEVIVPAAALALVLAALWPRFRRWAGWGPLGLAVASLILVPISTESGQSLEERVSENSALERHTQLGEGLLGWVIGLALIAAPARPRECASKAPRCPSLADARQAGPRATHERETARPVAPPPLTIASQTGSSHWIG